MVITSGLLKAVARQRHRADRRNPRHRQHPARRSSTGAASAPAQEPTLARPTVVLVPEIAFLTNDAWPIVRGTANGRGAPLLLMDQLLQGHSLRAHHPRKHQRPLRSSPAGADHDRQYMMGGFPVWIDAPAKVSLFAYDNRSFVVESYLDTPTPVTVSTAGASPASAQSRHRRSDGRQTHSAKAGQPRPGQRTEFKFEMPAAQLRWHLEQE